MTRERWFALDALDVLSFRDARPFVAGEQHGVRSLFPPLPTTVQGAMRTALLGQLCEGRRGGPRQELGCPICGAIECGGWSAVGRAGQPPFQVGPVLPALLDGSSSAVDLLWPCPLDILAHRGPEGTASLQVTRAVPLELPRGASTDLDDSVVGPLGPLGARSPVRHEPLRGWLTTRDLEQALSAAPGATDKLRVRAPEDLWEHEPRPGVALNERKTVREGHLYFIEAIRLRAGVTVAARVRGEFPLRTPCRVRLGGEGHVVEIREVKAPALPAAPESLAGGRLRLVLATPGIFGGRCPRPGMASS